MDYSEAKSTISQAIGFIQWSTELDSDIRMDIIKKLHNVRLYIKSIKDKGK